MVIIKKIIYNFKISFIMGNGLLSKLKFFFVTFLLPINKCLGRKNNPVYELKLKKFNRSFTFHLTDGSDLAVLIEIFIKGEYDIKLSYIPRIIFDLGSNVGLSVAYFKLKYPESKVYAFEPDPETFKKLKRNVKQFEDVYVYNIAISDKNSREKFYSYPNSSMSSSTVRRIADQEYIKVDNRSLDSLIKELKIESIDLMKFDIEGAEMKVFKGCEFLKKIKYLVGELHIDLIHETKENFYSNFKHFNIKDCEISKNRRYILTAENKYAT